MYPENTLTAFEKAASLKGLTGIELDIQMTKDGHMVVIHDEKVDRTTDNAGQVADYTLKELKCLVIDAGGGSIERIPTIEEVLDLIEEKMRTGLLLNIELKNSVIRYEGMEEKIIDLIHKWGLTEYVLYSSFNSESLALIKKIDPKAGVAVLDWKASDCLGKIQSGVQTDVIHPYWEKIDVEAEILNGLTVRAWFLGHLYPEKPTGTMLDLKALEKKGITDVFLNEPERYV